MRNQALTRGIPLSFRLAISRGASLLLLLLLTACASVPLDTPRTPSSAIVDTDATRMAQASSNWRAAAPDSNGFYPLTKGKDAFGARLALMDRAEVSIDAQYFLMKPDNAGLVFAARLLQAADRGIRVRFLLDDIFTTVDDDGLALLNEHPNVELRIFNPIARKGLYAFNYVGNFKLANRRMHNKSFTVDNQVSIVGGRNIAVEYFQLETSGEFIDFDMLVAGPVVKEVSASFDDYWNHELAVPFEVLQQKADPQKMEKELAAAKKIMVESGESIYADATHTQLMQDLLSGKLDPYPGSAHLIVDDPAKLLHEISEDYQHVAAEIGEVLSLAEKEVIIFTPYFIPGKRGMEIIRELRHRGVRIVLMTNSLATNNHTAVHSAYSGHRKDVLEAGVELWEARGDAAKITAPDGSTQLEHLTLHTKGILIDRKLLFVGSLNLDPRSIEINSEMGLIIESPELSGQLSEFALEHISDIAYRLELDENRKISWHATIDGKEVVETREPQTSAWRRFQAWFLKIAPEKQL